MQTLTLEGQINPEKQIVVDLPDDVYIGRVRLTIEPLDLEAAEPRSMTLEAARAILREAGILATPEIAGDIEPLSDEELESLNRQLPPSLPSEALIDEDRAEY